MTGGRRWWWAAGGAAAIAAGVAAALVLASGGGPAPRARPPGAPAQQSGRRPALAAPSGQAFGVNVNRLFNDFTYPPAEIDAQLAAVQATGATIARSDALWEATEPHAPTDGRHSWDWSFDDLIAGSLARHALTWLPILDYSAPWAQSIAGQDHSPPRSDAAYAAYAAAFAARYGAGGAFWQEHPELTPDPVTTIEIWNEPDNGQFWQPAPDPQAYASLYLVARDAVDSVDPRIRVIIGGLTQPKSFLPALVQAQPALAGHVDGVAIHPYGRPAVVASKVRAARAALAALGMATVPLYVTEFGWSTQPPGSPDYAPAAKRPAYIRQTLSELGHLGCGIAASLLYTWVTPERDPTDAQDWYGIANPSSASSATPGTAAFAAGLKAAAAPPASGGAACAH